MDTDTQTQGFVDAAEGNGNVLVERAAAGIITSVNHTNLQIFTGTLGSPPVPITNSQDPQRIYEVNGSTFTDFTSASNRACSVQSNLCSNAANDNKAFAVGGCNTQASSCTSALATSQTTNFQVLRGSEGDFDIICDN